MDAQTTMPRGCKRLSRDATKAERIMRHVAKVEMKRSMRSIMGTGFKIVRNERLDKAVDGATVALLLANQARVEKGLGSPMSPDAAREEALRQVRSSLPRRPMVRDWSTDRLTKNADPSYRKN